MTTEQLKQVREALESCAVGGYRDVDGDWCERKHFDTDKVADALSIIRAQEESDIIHFEGVDDTEQQWKDRMARKEAPAPEGQAIEDCPELNLSNYDAEDVARLNDWATRASLLLAASGLAERGADVLPKQFTDQELGKSFEAEMSRRRDNVRGADALQALVDLTDAFHEGRAVPVDEGSTGYVKSLVDSADQAIATATTLAAKGPSDSEMLDWIDRLGPLLDRKSNYWVGPEKWTATTHIGKFGGDDLRAAIRAAMKEGENE